MRGYMVELMCDQVSKTVAIARPEGRFSVVARASRTRGIGGLGNSGGLSGIADDSGPVAVCLCIDKSGSMSGEKWKDTLEAATFLIQSLDDADFISIVAFDDNAEIVVQGKQATDKESLIGALHTMSMGCSTNMYQGIQAALGDYYPGLDDLGLKLYRWNSNSEIFEPAETFEPYASAGVPTSTVKRIILLSDGQPTVGKTGIEDFEEISKRARTLGIPISTVGIGNDHDSKLLTMIADMTGGKYYYASGSQIIGGVIGIEVGTMKEVAVQCPSIELTFPKGTKIEDAFLTRPIHSDLRIMRSDEDSIEYILRDIEYDEPLEMFFQARFTNDNGGMQVRVRLLSRLGEELASCSIGFIVGEREEGLNSALQNAFDTAKGRIGRVRSMAGDAEKLVLERGDELTRKVEQAVNAAKANKLVPWMPAVQRFIGEKGGAQVAQGGIPQIHRMPNIPGQISQLNDIVKAVQFANLPFALPKAGFAKADRLSDALSLFSTSGATGQMMKLVHDEMNELRVGLDPSEIKDIEEELLRARFAPQRIPQLLQKLRLAKNRRNAQNAAMKYMEYPLGDVRSVAVGTIIGRDVVAVASDWGLEILSSSGAVLARFDVGAPFEHVTVGRVNRKEMILAVAGGELYAVFEGELVPDTNAFTFTNFTTKGRSRPMPRFIERLGSIAGIAAIVKDRAAKALDSHEIFGNAFVYLPGKGLEFTKSEAANVKRYLEGCGMLIVDDADGQADFEKAIAGMFPDRKAIELDENHPVLTGAKLSKKPMGVFDDYGRLMALFIPDRLEEGGAGATRAFANAIGHVVGRR